MEKPYSEFYPSKSSKNGYRYECEKCSKLRKYYYGNKTSRAHRDQLGQLEFLKYVAFYGKECPVCGKKMTNIFGEGYYNDNSAITIDRIIPKSEDGTMNPDNLWPLCRSCNSSKGSKDLDIFLEEKGLNIQVQKFDPSLPGDSLEKYWELLAYQFNNTSRSISDIVAKKFTKHLDIYVPVDRLTDFI